MEVGEANSLYNEWNLKRDLQKTNIRKEKEKEKKIDKYHWIEQTILDKKTSLSLTFSGLPALPSIRPNSAMYFLSIVKQFLTH
jgi:hypothetical protein